MSTKKCVACRELGHDRSDCPVINAGKEALAQKNRNSQQEKDLRFHLEGMRRAARGLLIAKYGEEEFERMAAEKEAEFERMSQSHEVAIRAMAESIGKGIGIATVSEENMPEFIKEFEKRGANSEEAFNEAIAAVGGARVDTHAEKGAETISEYWARRRKEEQDSNSELN